jgi:hypothetical protein
METYSAHASPSLALWGVPMPENLFVAELPYYSRPAVLALHNGTGSGKIVRVFRVGIGEFSGATSTEFAYEIQAISAASGGASVGAIAFDGTAPALPSQVSIVTAPASITSTGVLRRSPSVLVHGAALALNHMLKSNTIARWQGHADAQRITLREGQGIAAVPIAEGRSQASFATVLLRVGANAYCVHAPLSSLAIFNGVGSGVVVEVVSIEFSIVSGYLSSTPEYALERIEGLDDASGDAAAVVSHDSANAPSGLVRARVNALCTVDGATSGAWLSRTAIRRQVGMHLGNAPGLAKPVFGVRHGVGVDDIFRAPNADGSIVLREGQGLGVFARNDDTYFKPQIGIVWTVENAASGVTLIARAFA